MRIKVFVVVLCHHNFLLCHYILSKKLNLLKVIILKHVKNVKIQKLLYSSRKLFLLNKEDKLRQFAGNFKKS